VSLLIVLGATDEGSTVKAKPQPQSTTTNPTVLTAPVTLQ
jgi:hypothetical protein